MGVSFHHFEFEDEICTAIGTTAKTEITEKDLLSVKSLNCTNFDFNCDDLDVLCKCKNLEVLEMNIGNTDLSFLTSFPKLKELDIEYWSHGNFVDFNRFVELHELSYLRVSGGDISNMDMINLHALTKLTNLKELHLHEFGTVDLQFLGRMPWLESFYCGYANSVRSVEMISLLPKLRELTLIDIDIENQSFLENLPENLELELCGVNFHTDFDISKFNKYKDPDICEITVNGKAIRSSVNNFCRHLYS